MFQHLGVVEAQHPDKTLDLETVAIEAGAQNVETIPADDAPDHISARFLCDRTDLDTVSKALKQAGWAVTASEMSYVAKNHVELPAAQRPEVVEFLTAIDEHDDVHRVYTALT